MKNNDYPLLASDFYLLNSLALGRLLHSLCPMLHAPCPIL